MIYFSLFLAFSYTIPILRISKFLACSVGLYMIHVTTPTPDPLASYIKPIQKGSKGGETSVKFSKSAQLEVVFQIEEDEHPVYRRQGNNLYAELTITSKEAEKGCKKRLEALDPDENAIEITIPPKKYSFKKEKEHLKRGFSHFVSRNSVKIRKRGWPVRTNASSKSGRSDEYRYGDLFVTIRVQRPSVKRR
jgi:DnaJ-class molecular chaperone